MAKRKKEDQEEESSITEELLLGLSEEEQSSPLTATLLLCIFSVACGCFSTGCIVGYSSPVEYQILQELGISVEEYSVFGSMMIVGGLVGSVGGGKIAELIGRKRTILGLDGLFIVGWVLIATAKGAFQLDFGRLLLGIASTITLYLAPVYISEITPRNLRGTAVSVTQLTMICSVSLMFLVGSIINWRTMALIGAIPGLVQLVITFFIPESPRWLAKSGKEKEFEAVLVRLRGPNADISWEVDEIKEYTKTIQSLSKNRRSSVFDLFQKQYALPLIVGNGLMVLQQFSGMNSYVLYTGAIFASAGSKLFNTESKPIKKFLTFDGTFDDMLSLLLSGIPNTTGFLTVSAFQLVGTVFTAIAMDRYGRRPLLLVTVIGASFGSFLTALSYILQGFEGWSKVTPILALISILVYSGCMSIGNGIPWMIIAEVFFEFRIQDVVDVFIFDNVIRVSIVFPDISNKHKRISRDNVLLVLQPCFSVGLILFPVFAPMEPFRYILAICKCKCCGNWVCSQACS
ncbi:Sugar transporter ERD6-like 11 [Linum perenne]